MNISFDEKADALYIQFQTGKAKETLKIRDGILIDIDKNGKLYGIEILDVSEKLEPSELVNISIENLPLEKVAAAG